MQENWMHFLGQVNREACCLIEGDDKAAYAKACGAELVLWHLSQEMPLLADEKAFGRRAEEMISGLPDSGRLALLWDNPFSVHAFCGGFRENGTGA